MIHTYYETPQLEKRCKVMWNLAATYNLRMVKAIIQKVAQMQWRTLHIRRDQSTAKAKQEFYSGKNPDEFGLLDENKEYCTRICYFT